MRRGRTFGSRIKAAGALLAAAVYLPALAAPPDVLPLLARMREARDQLRIKRTTDEQSRNALLQAQKAEALAIELNERPAIDIARQAVETAQRALSISRRAIAADEARVQSLTAQASELCRQWEAQGRTDREAIERLGRSRALTQTELDEWSRLNAQAQKEALLSVAEALISEYVADIERVRAKASALHAAALVRAERAANATARTRQLKELRRLEDATTTLSAARSELFSKEWSQAVLDVNQIWNLARDTWHHEFRVAAAKNQNLQQVLNDAEFKEAFIGDGSSPGTEVVRTLLSEAAIDAGKFSLGLERYQAWAGPYVRAADFTIKMSYASTKSILSMQRVLQFNSLAGDEAAAAKSLQLQRERSVRNTRECAAAGVI